MTFPINPNHIHKRHLELENVNKGEAGKADAQKHTKRRKISALEQGAKTSLACVKRAFSDLLIHAQAHPKQGILFRSASQSLYFTEEFNKKSTSEILVCLEHFLTRINQLQATSYREGACIIAEKLKKFIANPLYFSKLNILINVESQAIKISYLLQTAALSNLEKLSQAKTESQFLNFRDLFKGIINLVRIAIATNGREDLYKKFVCAAAADDIKTVKALVKKEVIPDFAIAAWGNSKDLVHTVNGNLTAMGHACVNNAQKVVQWLIKTKQADPNFSIKEGSYRVLPELTSHFIDLHQPYVMPAWTGTLMSAQDHFTKKRIWSEFGGRADIMLTDGDSWMLSKCFFTTQATPEDLHMALNTVDLSVPEIKSKMTAKFLVENEAFLSATRKELSHKIALKQRQAIDIASKAQFLKLIETLENHSVKLAIVAAYHNMPVNRQEIWTLRTFPGYVSDFSNWGMVMIGGQEMSVAEAAHIRQKQNESDVKLENKVGWSAEIMHSLRDSLVKDVISIIIDYSVKSELQICNALFQATFGTTKYEES